MVNSGRALPRCELPDHDVLLGLQIGHAMALDVADGGVGGQLVERAVRHHEPLGRQLRRGLALGPAHLRVQLLDEVAGVRRRRRGGSIAGLQVHGRQRLGPAAGEHGPSLDAHRDDLRVPGRTIPQGGAHGEGAAQPGHRPELRVVEREAGVDPAHAVHERDALHAVVHAFQRFPVLELHRGIHGSLRRSERLVLIQGRAVLR